MIELKNPHVRISDSGTLYYGGNQRVSDREQIKKCGCGIVAAADFMIYMRLYRFPSAEVKNPIPLPRYNKYLKYLNNNFFPLVPNLGMHPLELAGGMNLMFMKKHIPLRASWKVSGEKLFERMEEQLGRDFPVIICIGPNFPLFWGREKLSFYKLRDGSYEKNCATKGHFVTVTGLDEKYMRISSWGQEFYVSRDEFKEYARKKSSSLICNMISIREI